MFISPLFFNSDIGYGSENASSDPPSLSGSLEEIDIDSDVSYEPPNSSASSDSSHSENMNEDTQNDLNADQGPSSGLNTEVKGGASIN